MEQALVEYLANALWQLPLLAGSTWLLLRLLKPGPRAQHGAWIAVLALAVALPLIGMRATPAKPGGQVIVTAAPTPGQLGGLRLGPGTTRWLVRLYLVSVGIGVLRIACAWRMVKLLVNNSRETRLDARTMAAFEEYGQRLGVKLPRLRTSDAVSSPMVVGLRTAALLLPDDFESHAENEMRAALCHELAHVGRRDYLVNLACEVAAVPLTWHPATHEVLQRIRTTREMVCDAMAAQEMDSQLGYAKCLLALAHSMLGEHGMSIGLFSKHTLEERVMQLTENTTMKARASVARIATGLAVMIATGAITTTFHVTPTMAQATPAPELLVIAPASAPAPAPRAEIPDAKPSRARRERKALTTAEQFELKRKLEHEHQQMAKATHMLNSPEFEQRMADAQRQMAKSMAMLNNPDFKRRMDDVQKQMAETTGMMNSQEFKQHMEDAQRQMAKATAMLDSPEFKRRMEDAQRQMDTMEQTIREALPPPDAPESK